MYIAGEIQVLLMCIFFRLLFSATVHAEIDGVGFPLVYLFMEIMESVVTEYKLAF
jgi:hypothetical protein